MTQTLLRPYAAIVIATLAATTTSNAQTASFPQAMPLQGRLALQTGGNAQGVKMTFRIYTAEIRIPEEWKLVTESSGITVQLTPLRSLARLTVLRKSRDHIVILGDQDSEFDYFVNGVRRGFAKH